MTAAKNNQGKGFVIGESTIGDFVICNPDGSGTSDENPIIVGEFIICNPDGSTED